MTHLFVKRINGNIITFTSSNNSFRFRRRPTRGNNGSLPQGEA